MGPLARQGDFYVPEVRRAERRLSEEDELHSDSDVSGWFIDTNGGVRIESEAQRKTNSLSVVQKNGHGSSSELISQRHY